LGAQAAADLAYEGRLNTHKRFRVASALLAVLLVAVAAYHLRLTTIEPVDRPSQTDEGQRPAATVVMPTGDEAAAVSGGPTFGNVDSKVFSCRTRSVTYGIRLWGSAASTDGLRKLACGNPQEAIDELVKDAKEGSLSAFAALDALMGQCERGWRLDSRTSDQEIGILTRLHDRRVGPHVVERVRQLLAASRVDSAWCHRLKADMPGLSGERSAALNSALGRPFDPAIDGPFEYLAVIRKLAEGGNAYDQMRIAGWLLVDGRTEQQIEAMKWLKQAARTLPDAKAELAACLIQGCPTPSDDLIAAHDLLKAAARQGSRVAISILADGSEAARRGLNLDLSPTERYAWQQLYDDLIADGCFGVDMYISWATDGAKLVDTSEMPVSERQRAEEAATNLHAASFDRVRNYVGCAN
jgi:hypothetical protein